jgi:ribonuclease HI
MIPRRNKHLLAVEYIWEYSPWKNNRVYPFKQELLSNRKHIVSNTTEAYFPTAKIWEKRIKATLLKYEGRGARINFNLFKKNLTKISSQIPHIHCVNYARFLTYTSRTDARDRFLYTNTQKLPPTRENFPCRFCNRGIDTITHYLIDCKLIQAFWAMLQEQAPVNIFPGKTNLFESLCLQNNRWENKGKGILLKFQIALFSVLTCIHTVRRDIRINNIRTKENKASLLLSHFKQVNKIKNICYKLKTLSYKNYIQEFIGNLPNDHLRIFTDGSFIPEENSGGAGAVIYDNNNRLAFAEASLGAKTNNFAEVYAIGMALLLAVKLPNHKKYKRIHIFSDSLYAINCATMLHNTKVESNIPILRIVRTLLRSFHKLKWHITIHYVPSHMGVEGNECVDSIANRAAKNARVREVKLSFCLDFKYHLEI